MNIWMTVGRIFFGIGIAGIGMLHFFYPGIRPIIIPGLAASNLSVIGYLIGVVLIGAGVLIASGKKYNNLSLLMGILFFLLFLFGHLPRVLSTGSLSNYWVNLNKILALSGGFLVVSTISPPKPGHRLLELVARTGPWGKYLFAIMLFNFGIGHFISLEGVSRLVPKYIPFPQFWTFLGGVALVGSAISIFSNYKVKLILLLLGLNLFIWLLSLHLYYAINFPQWQEGENFIGFLTCLCFCGTALSISQTASKE
ncbi:Uncharacterized membrane protein [Chitinophaga rupis]|uniref:Uncharacterized membrane protein n=1 Tax=Chitinophaga rupis TaxID=573321 RepID=A0A1H7PSV2_9BACT|nr:hypothetical protein [Chitinophaga rupis]SEL38474.1 Uncharacterized membrane protein [Chitinophaga rupis]